MPSARAIHEILVMVTYVGVVIGLLVCLRATRREAEMTCGESESDHVDAGF